MDLFQLLQAVLSLCFVIGLLLLTLWAFKNCEKFSLRCKFIRGMKEKQRIKTIERHSLDSKNQIFLVQVDEVEHLLLISPYGNQTLQQTKIKGNNHNE